LQNKKQCEWYGSRGWYKYRKTLLKGFTGNSKRFYGYMRGIQRVKDNVTGLQRPDGTLTESGKEAADVLGNCIQLMFTKEVVSNQDNQENNSQELRTTS